MGTSSDILFEVDDKGIATLTLNRPDRLNAISTIMLEELIPQTCAKVNEDDNIRTLIITGAGRGFCSGGDAEERVQARQKGLLKFNRKELERPVASTIALPIAEIAKPVIAAVNGIAAGAGLGMVLLCDFRIASDKARFSVIFPRRGMMPDTGITFSLPRVVGLPKALELMYTGDIIDAKEAERIGLVNKVVPHDMLMDEARALAEKLNNSAPIALSFTKRAAYHGLLHNLYEQLEYESWGARICVQTEDAKEGIAAFLEKRPPNFQGR